MHKLQTLLLSVNLISLSLIAFPLMGKAALAEQVTDGVSNNNTSSSYLSLSVTSSSSSSSTGSDNPNLYLQAPEGGGIATGWHTLSVSTSTSISKYSISMYGSSIIDTTSAVYNKATPIDMIPATSTNTTFIKSLSGSNVVLEDNTWGYSLTKPDTTSQATLETSTWNAIPSSDSPVAIVDGATSTADSVSVYYGTKTASLTQADTYTGTITYTVTAELTPPTITSIAPDNVATDEANHRLTITGTNLDTTSEVFIDFDGDKAMDDGEACTIESASAEQVICVAPKYSTAGTYSLYLTTAAGIVSRDVVYYEPTQRQVCGIKNGSSDETLCVDYDLNMIPIKFAGNITNSTETTDNSGSTITLNVNTANWVTADVDEVGDWYDYNTDVKQWANAVTIDKTITKEVDYATVENGLGSDGARMTIEKGASVDATTYYLNAPAGTTLDSDDIKGYWVYVPRYKYKVMRCSATDEAVAATNFTIEFQKSTDSKYLLTDDTCAIGSWTTHPGFTFGSTELNGLWVGKFETTGTRTAPTIKPNQQSNISEQIGNFYTMIKSMGVEDVDNVGGNTVSGLTQNSHGLSNTSARMLKNSEWGAVAYLSASAYGAGVNKVKINSANPINAANSEAGQTGTYQYDGGTDADGQYTRFGRTGCGPANATSEGTYTDATILSSTLVESPTACSTNTSVYDSTTGETYAQARAYNGSLGALASTTNNIYGVYDMSGGSWDYVAGSLSSSETTSSTSWFSKAASVPYVDIYLSSIFNNSTEYSTSYLNNNNCTWATCGGHALYEVRTHTTVSGRNQSWGQDYSNFVYSGVPWFARGADSWDGSYTGVFASGRYGYAGVYYASRAVLSPVPRESL